MDWRDQKVLVTGAAGFVGGWLAKTLADKGAQVVVLVRDEKKYSALDLHDLREKVITIKGDVADYHLIKRILNEHSISFCFHLAAQAIVGIANRSPLSTFETNIKGTWTLLEAIREVNNPHFQGIIVASTDKAYGVHEQLPYTEESELKGLYPYDASKVCADVLARCYAVAYNMPVAVTRKANVYGGGDLNLSRIVPDAIRCLVQGQELLIRSDGTPERDYLYIKDAVAGYIILAENMNKPEVRGQAFNFSSGKPVSVLQLVNVIAKTYGVDIQPKILGQAKNEIDRQFLANGKAKAVLGWAPQYSLDDGMKETVEWYKEHFKKY
ncbi:MAG: SDR family NAD(P)-dependent oxidoreductase [Nanoarchaeota archaeon]